MRRSLKNNFNLLTRIASWTSLPMTACVLCCSVSFAFPYQDKTSEPKPERRTQLISLVRQDCGSCHGLTLKGGLGPSLLPESLRDKPAQSMEATILFGRPGTAMPPWKNFLNEEEAAWIVQNLQKGFPNEIR